MTWELLRFDRGKYLLLGFHRVDICADFCCELNPRHSLRIRGRRFAGDSVGTQ